MRIKLHDVAQRAGVSEATVSRVVNAKPGVSDRKRAEVLAVLAELGYEPPELRRTDRLRTIGLIVPELDNPIFPAFSQAIEAQLASAGCMAVLCCAGRNGSAEADYLSTLVDQNVAGIIVVSGLHAIDDADHRMYHAVGNRRIPMVFVGGGVNGLSVPSVSTDEAEAARMAVAHLAHLGHERIGFLTGPRNHRGVMRRLEGYRSAMSATNGDVDDSLIESSLFSVEGGRVGAHHLLTSGATAIMAGSDVMALGAIRAVRETGRDVPGDVSVVGYDDTDLMAFTDPPLTTIRQPVAAITDHAVELLLAQIGGGPVTTSEFLVRPDLIVRGSTGRTQASVLARS
ncbi:LacI family DNA-binding transcriptional regulator [Ilumatobacter sp.]|uniref:LacI family DNA-binding transcriptional regulator n=1 Tax=Ilumatobacter sp. TaxID=1967498 RepID=UPI00345E0587